MSEEKKSKLTFVGKRNYHSDSTFLRCVCGDYTYYKDNQKKRIQLWKEYHERECTAENLAEAFDKRIAKHEKELVVEKETLRLLHKHIDQGIRLELTFCGELREGTDDQQGNQNKDEKSS